jgi:hypothetical protein
MKRFIYSAVAFATLAVSSSTPASARGLGDLLGVVTMCDNGIQISVKITDVVTRLAQGAILGSCPVPPPPPPAEPQPQPGIIG